MSSDAVGQAALGRSIERAIQAIELLIERGLLKRKDGAEAAAGADLSGYSKAYRQKLAILRALVDMTDPVIVPRLEPTAPLGHSCPAIDESLGLPPGGGLIVLASLAEHGLLRTELHNRIHTCPDCGRCQLNFRETCPICGSFDLEVERLIHHFSCAYSGLESEFQQGFELVCPKCRKTLDRLGQDFERANDTYVCHESEHLFDDPLIEGQCLCCGKVSAGDDLKVVPIHRYRPTQLTVRAVELNRLTGLDVSEIMYDADLQLNTRDFLSLQIKRELMRLEEHGGAMTTAVLCFEGEGGIHPVFRDWSTGVLRDVARTLVGDLRELDLVARLDASRFGILFPDTGKPEAERIRERIVARFDQYSFQTATGRELRPIWRHRAWTGPGVTLSEVRAFFDGEGR